MFHSSILKKLFRSYLYVLLPMLLISMLLFQVLIGSMKTDMNISISASLRQLAEKLSIGYQSHYNMAAALSSEQDLSRYAMTNKPSSATSGLSIIRQVRAYDTTLAGVFVCYDSEVLYTDQGLIRTNNYLNSSLKLTEEGIGAALALLQSDMEGMRILNDNDGALLLYHYPIRLSAVMPRSINFLMDVNQIFSEIGRLVSRCEYTVSITDAAGSKLCFFCVPGEDIRLIDITDVSGDTLLETDAGITGLHLAMHYDAGAAYRYIYWWQTSFVIVMAILLLVMLMFSYRLSVRQFQPIDRLAHTLESANAAWPEASASTRKSVAGEFESMQKGLEQLIHSVEESTALVRHSRDMLRQQSATLMFRGLVRDENTIDALFELNGAVRNEAYYTVMCVLSIRRATVSTLAAELEGVLFEELYAADACTVAALLELPTLDEEKRLRTEKAYKVLSLAGNDTVVTFSSVRTDSRHIPEAYAEALVCMENLRTLSIKHVAFADETTTQNVFDDEISAFEVQIRKDRLDETLRCLDTVHYAMQTELPHNTRKLLKRRLVRSIVAEISVRFKPEEDGGLLSEALDVMTLSDGEYWIHLRKIICDIYEKSNNSRRFAVALKYIQEHYTNSDLSLDLVAEHAGFHKSQLSRLFKANMGTLYIDYITSLRICRAHILLLETNLPIQEIANMVGFIDVQWFRRRYRDRYGVNPSERAVLPVEHGDEN